MAEENYDINSEYSILSLIGRGMTGKVYKAERKSDEKIFAIKISHMKYLRTIKREIDILSNIRKLEDGRCHKHIICYNEGYHIGMFRGEKSVILIMEYLEGYDLSNYIETLKKSNERINDEQLRKFMVVMLDTINFLHLNNIVHRDIKTDNIMYNKDDLVIIDFGFSCIEKCLGLAGTPNYLSPELAELVLKEDMSSKSLEFWFKCDIWALGIVFFKLLFLNRPYTSEDRDSLLKEIIEKDIIIEYHDKMIQDVINLCLTKNPKDRPSSGLILNYIKKNYNI